MSTSGRIGWRVCIDVPDLARAEAFYVAAFGLAVGRRFAGFTELVGGPVPLDLLEKRPGSKPTPTDAVRDYARHWTPVHLDVVVDDLDAALATAIGAGARLEVAVRNESWGRIAGLVDPFGHGIDLLEFTAAGYDALAGRVNTDVEPPEPG